MLEQLENKKLSKEEISEKLSIPLSEVEEYLKYIYEYVSLDQPIDEDNELLIMDFISVSDDVEDQAFREILKDEITNLFKTLSEKEIKIIKMRFGLGKYYNNPIPINTIAKEMSISKGRVRQIEQRALEKMKRLIKIDNSTLALKEFMK